MRISDWSSDVCSSDLGQQSGRRYDGDGHIRKGQEIPQELLHTRQHHLDAEREHHRKHRQDDNPDRSQPIFPERTRSEEHTSELQSLMRISYAVFCLKKKKKDQKKVKYITDTQQTRP